MTRSGGQRKLLVFRVAECERPGLLGGVVGTDLFGLGEAAARTRVLAAGRSAVTGRAKPQAERLSRLLGGHHGAARGFPACCRRCGTSRRVTRTLPAGRPSWAVSGRGLAGTPR